MVPGTDGELTQVLATLEEVLLALRPAHAVQADLPSTEPDDLHALQHICMVLFATERGGAPQLYAPGGTVEYAPLFFFQVLDEDLAALGRAIAKLGAALLPGGDPEVYDALGQAARPGQARQDLVVAFAQAHAVLDLAPDDDSRFLVETLIKEQGPVVLSAAQDEAYGRLSRRFLDLQLSGPLARFLSRGGMGERRQRGS